MLIAPHLESSPPAAEPYGTCGDLTIARMLPAGRYARLAARTEL